ncbi:universal stress protein [Arthrobacter polaris]|uniref:universal stress protein n=1 Tax=Arthrobacter polaris TaxID=2813727 RepID=UPI001F2A57D6|nr:universal stress protein [Arthrobacter polaris]UIK89881.1 universal stress protein [Arthrobacter polaris]
MEAKRAHEGSHIVVGVDGSDESVLALKWAQTLAHSLAATITAVTAWQVETMFGTYISPDWDPNEDAGRILKDAVHRAFADNPPEGFNGVTVRGRPAQVLLEAAQSAQMLIVGSRGRGGFKGMLLGSVSSACVEHASCPVLVVHTSANTASMPATAGTHQADTDVPVRNS